MEKHEVWMRRALREGEKAISQDEIPVGAVVVLNDEIVGRGYNQTESLNDPTAHAEMIAISAAANTLQSWRLENCTLYVTLEPCAMCSGAVVLSRLKIILIGTIDTKTGASGSQRKIVQDHRLNHQVEVLSNVLEKESSEILKQFFRQIRVKKSGKT